MFSNKNNIKKSYTLIYFFISQVYFYNNYNNLSTHKYLILQKIHFLNRTKYLVPIGIIDF